MRDFNKKSLQALYRDVLKAETYEPTGSRRVLKQGFTPTMDYFEGRPGYDDYDDYDGPYLATQSWSWKHPFTFNKTEQDLNELQDKIESGKEKKTILVRFTKIRTVDNSIHHGGDIDVLVGRIIAPKSVEVEPKDLGLIGTNRSCELSLARTAKKVTEFSGCKVQYAASQKLKKDLDNVMNG